ncbi:unnamed protein product, partial [Cyprideis torosa]
DSCVRLLTLTDLDRETYSAYTLNLTATDVRTGEVAGTTLSIEVTDVNDHLPKFHPRRYSFLLPVTLGRLRTIGKVRATDGDGERVRYKLVGSNHNLFMIVPLTGEILLLDKPEIRREYEIKVTAVDERLAEAKIPAVVRITVYDPDLLPEASNEVAHPSNSPIKRSTGQKTVRSTVRKEFPETNGSREGQSIFALDSRSLSEKFYIRDQSNPWVKVDENGVVRVKKKWDYEELGPEKTINFWVRITNEATGDTSYQRVIITVTDVNDEPPYFINRPLPMQAVVKLNAPPRSHVYTLQARDPDTDSNLHFFLVRDRTGGRFEVDERTGVVRTLGNDAFQLDMEYVLFVRAEDHNGVINGTYQSTPEERLSIVGGKRPPQFYLPSYETEIPENQRKDSDIIAVKAKSFAERDIRYTLKAQGQGAGTFSIEPTTGVVQLAKELDFEDLRQPHAYNLIVTATEDSGGFSTSVELTIKVTDVNDNSPKFELPDYQAHNVDEDKPIGTSIIQVRATDADSGANAEIEYSVSDSHFRIDNIGIIYNNQTLDADDNNAYYEFIVSARDKGDPPNTGTATVRIYTKNKNDEAPRFSQAVYTPNVDENAGPSTLVATVVASDKDGDGLRFGFEGGTTRHGQFIIEPDYGVIRLHSGPVELDQDKYDLVVTATDDGSCCEDGRNKLHTSSAVVVVFITDVNDNKPVFKDCDTYNPQVEENSLNGEPVITVKAQDRDKGENGRVRYSIVQQPNQKGTKFTVDPATGVVRTNKVFDRESPEDGKFVSVTVKATDHGDPPLEGVCSFTVEITDQNDNAPLFDRQRYDENVKQDTAINAHILRVSASDEDADLNGAIVYSLLPSGHNHILPSTDCENELENRRDGGVEPQETTVPVKIKVVDLENKAPNWEEYPRAPVTISEMTPVGSTFLSLSARSGIEDNPVVFYSLIDGSSASTNKENTFYLQPRQDGDKTWADIKVNKPLDYEELKEYNLTIKVKNNGPQQLSKETIVTILLEDENDEIPLFEEREEITVLEGEPPGTRVTQIKATDKDGVYPNNAVRVTYRIVPSPNNDGDKYFHIDPRTGIITTRQIFDREEKQAYALQIEAIDGARSARPDVRGENRVTKFIRIGVADKNDNPPYFDKDVYEAEVDENEDKGHTVLTVIAHDKDESSRIRYEITKGNVAGAFGVKNMTGAIYVVGSLDFETRNRYDLELTASDSRNENTTRVIINIKDLNDRPPVFDRILYEAQITEETETDEPFHVLPALDRDQPDGRPQWRFTVFAQDEGGEGLVGYADVQINLKDINDKAPFFPPGQYFGNVTENSTAGMVVMTMTAVDYDDPEEGDNAKLTYSIDKNVIDDQQMEKPIFAIDPETGVITTNVCCLDREKTPEYKIDVVAVDGGGLKGTGEATIRVRDINDMPPRFSKDLWTTEVDETEGNLIPDAPILTVTVNDDDEPQTNKFHYKVLEGGFGADKFTMVRNSDGTGSLKIVQPLDFEDPQQRQGFHFNISVNDRGEDDNNTLHTAYARVHVTLRDINDNKPVFENPNIEKKVAEDAPIGTTFPPFRATDPDQAGSSRVTYAIDRSSDRRRQFTISKDGTVSIQRTLDREETPRHQLKILAIDDGVPPKTATATLTVIVLDINDNAPRFLKDYRPVIPENSLPRKIADISATDDDDRSKSNGPPFYFRMDPSAEDRVKESFQVEHNPTGANGDGMATVHSKTTFDREFQKEYHVPIIISDSGSPSLSGTSTLTVIIGDVNEYKMMPGSKEILVYKYTVRQKHRCEVYLKALSMIIWM